MIVDPTLCAGHGVCAHHLPERITLDDWNYPIVDPSPIPPDLLRHARRAVADCPALALSLRPSGDVPRRAGTVP
jgi:ferredoxin